jgi:hypothetical protein
MSRLYIRFDSLVKAISLMEYAKISEDLFIGRNFVLVIVFHASKQFTTANTALTANCFICTVLSRIQAHTAFADVDIG